MFDRQVVTDEQVRVFGSLWTESYTLLSHISYVRASPLRILCQALRRHGATKSSGLRILEYGFGHGIALFRFDRSAFPHGIELSAMAIEAATKKAGERGYQHFEFKEPPLDDPVRILFSSDCFDVVICSHTIEHVYSDNRLLGELCRVLKPGGKCFLLVPLEADHPGLLADEQQRRNPDFPHKSYHVWRYNAETFGWLVEKAGFTTLEVQALDAILDQRLGWNRPLQIGAALLFSALPYRVWQRLDHLSRNRGHHNRQCLVVATKAKASG
jgi:ubiquinone/menaquinone biosynthesis C-methylase UbiE